MGSNYKRIGDYIQLIDERNKGLIVKNLVGLSISKQFIKSVANTIGTDMENYKIIRQNQFACSTMQVRRDKKMPMALYTDSEPAIISQAYPVFEIKETTKLLPEYLMMWFTRSEFDREACFHAVGGVRGSLEWEDFCGMKLPIPSIEKQREIVNEYNTIVNRIALNEKLNQKLEETAQAIYKQWFVDFEFPDENGKSYKSNGGKMVWCEELEKEIPEGWDVKNLDDFFKSTLGGDWGKENIDGNYNSEVRCIRGADIPLLKKGIVSSAPTRFIIEKNLISRKVEQDQIIIEISGGSPSQSTGRAVLVTDYHLINIKQSIICSNFCRVLILKNPLYSKYVASHFEYLYGLDYLFAFENSTTGVKNFDLTSFLNEENLLEPNKDVISKFNTIYNQFVKEIVFRQIESEKISELKDLLLAKMTRTNTD